MSTIGTYGTLFELDVASTIFNFRGIIFLQNEENFECFEFGQTGNTSADLKKPILNILFTGPPLSGHFRILIPSNIDGFRQCENSPNRKFMNKKLGEKTFHIKFSSGPYYDTQATTDPDAEQLKTFDCKYCPIKTPRCFNSLLGLRIHMSKKHPKEYAQPNDSIIDDIDKIEEINFNAIFELKSKVSILKRIPKGARRLAAKHYSDLIRNCIEFNDIKSWQKLFRII